MKLEEVKGIGEKQAKELQDKGVMTLEDLAVMSTEELQSLLKCSYKVAKKMQEDALSKTIEKVVEVKLFEESEKYIKEKVKYISTGSKELDRILKGGVRTDASTMCFGPFASSKTQLAYQLMINCLDTVPESKVMFIETEPSCFSPERVREIRASSGKEVDYNRIFHIPARTIATPSHQYLAYLRTKKLLEKEEPIKLIIVDCLAPETKILTKNGLVPIKDLSSEVISVDGDRSHSATLVEQEVSSKVAIPHNKMLRIKTPYREITCSESHRLFTIGFSNQKGKKLKEIKARDVGIGQSLVVLKELPSWGDGYLGLRSSELLGFLMGDGHVAKNCITFDNSSKELLEYYRSLARQEGLSTGRVCSYRQGKYFRLTITKGKNLMLYNGLKSKDVDKMLNATKEEALAFLRGFFDAEGNIHLTKERVGKFGNYKGVSITFANKDLSLLKLVRELLLRIGCPALNPRLNTNQFGSCYSMVIRRTESVRRFIEIVKSSHPKKKIAFQSLQTYLSLSKGKNWGKRGILTVEKVKEIDIINRPTQTFEITVPNERYVANGFLVHNSFTAKFRGFFQKREQLGDRSREFARHFMLFDLLASKYNLAVFLTAQVMGIPTSPKEQVMALGRPESTVFGLRGQKVWGGETVTHSAAYVLALSRGAKDYWKAKIIDAPDLPEEECYFCIRPEGIRDYLGKGKAQK